MKTKPMSTSNKLGFLFVVAFFTVPAISYHHDNAIKETKLTLHLQDILGGPNATTVPYAGISGKAWKYDAFGTTFVSDDALTEAPNKNSREIARAQGIYVTSSFGGSNVLTLLSIVFTSKEYNGSTLEIQGRWDQFANITELSVVGGTGKFRFAKGFATFELLEVELRPTEIISVTRWNLTVLHY